MSELAAELQLARLRPSGSRVKLGQPRNLLTDQDIEIERLLAARILREYPDDGITGEEGAIRPSRSGITWIIDPIDGTNNLVGGSHFWAISLAAVAGTEIIAAVVHAPALGLEFSAAVGVGAWLQDQRIRLPTPRYPLHLPQALVATGLASSASSRARQLDAIATLASLALDLRMHGAASLELCLVACERQHAYFESGLSIWDVAAGALIATEAGASVSGRPLDDSDEFLVAACTAELAAEVRDTLDALAGTRVADPDNVKAQVKRYAADGGRRVAKSAGVVTIAGRGSYLIDSQGRRYLDFVTGFGVASLGHNHNAWRRSVRAQASRLTTSTFYEPTQGAYFEALREVFPQALDRFGLYSGGSEAVEVAVRLCQRATGKSGVLTFEGSFHGKTLAIRHSAGGASRETGVPFSRWLRIIPELRWQSPTAFEHLALGHRRTSNLEPTDLQVEGGLADIGCVLVEPVLGTAGNRPIAAPLFTDLRKLCDEQGWLLVFDESITGFGRTGAMFAAELFNVIPDVLVSGKGMGGGIPLSCVAASSRLWHAAGLDEPSVASTSFGGNPLACAAGLAVLRALRDEDIIRNVRRVGDYLLRELLQLQAAGWPIAASRGLGLMLGFDWTTSSGEVAATETCKSRFERLVDHGVLVAADVPRVRLSPPLTLHIDEARQFLQALASIEQ